MPATACVACVPVTGAAGGADVELLEHVGVLPELRRDLHDHMVLLRAERVVDRRDLGLRKRIAQRVVDLASVRPRREAAVAIDDQVGLQPAGLQVRVHVGRLPVCPAAPCAASADQARSSARSSPSSVYWYCELAERPPPAPDVLHRLQEGLHAGDLGELRAQAGDDLVGRFRALRQRLERDVRLASRRRRRSARSRRRPRCLSRADGRVLLDDVDDLLQLALHQLEERWRRRGCRRAAGRCPAAERIPWE